MKKTLTTTLALAATAVLVPLSASAAAKSTPDCPTANEFRSVENGMTKKQVHDLFFDRALDNGTRQNLPTGNTAMLVRAYTLCGGGKVFVQYESFDSPWVVTDKGRM